MSRFDSPGSAMFADDGEQVKAVVKWFNGAKGFGFVAPADGSADAFLHISVLNRAGMQQIAEGTELAVKIAQGAKGPQVTSIVEVLGTAPIPQSASNGGGMRMGSGRPAPTGPEIEIVGTVKWFKPDKGFGFVTADDGDKDIFVHKSILRTAGLADLQPGQRVQMKVQTASKGREATWIQSAE